MNIVIYDLASLELHWKPGGRSVRLVTSHGVTLAWLTDLEPDLTKNAVAFEAFEDALERARVRIPGSTTRFRVALYNPYTAQISVGATPKTQVFSADGPLWVPQDGLFGVVENDVVTLHDGTVLCVANGSLRELTQRLESHVA